MAQRFRAIGLGAVCGLIGCQYDSGDNTIDRGKHGAQTIERQIVASQRKYDIDQSKAYDKIGQRLADGEVLTPDQVMASLDKDLKPAYHRDFEPTNKMLRDAVLAEKKRYGRREARLFIAIARGFRIRAAQGGDENRTSDDRDDERRDDD